MHPKIRARAVSTRHPERQLRSGIRLRMVTCLQWYAQVLGCYLEMYFSGFCVVVVVMVVGSLVVQRQPGV